MSESHCQCCGEDLDPNSQAKYCSDECKKIMRPKRIRPCVNCGKNLKGLKHRTVYCSDECSREHHKKIYENSGSRFIIFERDNFACGYCGAEATDGVKLHVEHIFPLIAGGDNDINNLITACDRCNLEKSGHVMKPEHLKKFMMLAAKRNSNLKPVVYRKLKREVKKLFKDRIERTKKKKLTPNTSEG